jgi:hypothetical protein
MENKASWILPTCVIRTATSFALFTGKNRLTKALASRNRAS